MLNIAEWCPVASQHFKRLTHLFYLSLTVPNTADCTQHMDSRNIHWSAWKWRILLRRAHVIHRPYQPNPIKSLSSSPDTRHTASRKSAAAIASANADASEAPLKTLYMYMHWKGVWSVREWRYLYGHYEVIRTWQGGEVQRKETYSVKWDGAFWWMVPSKILKQCRWDRFQTWLLSSVPLHSFLISWNSRSDWIAYLPYHIAIERAILLLQSVTFTFYVVRRHLDVTGHTVLSNAPYSTEPWHDVTAGESTQSTLFTILFLYTHTHNNQSAQHILHIKSLLRDTTVILF